MQQRCVLMFITHLHIYKFDLTSSVAVDQVVNLCLAMNKTYLSNNYYVD